MLGGTGRILGSSGGVAHTGGAAGFGSIISPSPDPRSCSYGSPHIPAAMQALGAGNVEVALKILIRIKMEEEGLIK